MLCPCRPFVSWETQNAVRRRSRWYRGYQALIVMGQSPNCWRPGGFSGSIR
jgi:hypothetical protein